jgi:predicted DCC family thiol-disulfide oxidoreductase YuxK
MSADPASPSAVSLPLLVFDGDCAFCSSSVRAGQRWIGRMATASPYQTTDLGQFGLTAAECERAVRYVTRDRRVLAGENAVSMLLVDAGRGWWLLGSFMRLPGVHWLSGVAYRWVARNRHRLPGGTPACSLADRPGGPSRRT